MKRPLFKQILIAAAGLILGILIGFLLSNYQTSSLIHIKETKPKQVIGFLPYWLLDRANIQSLNNLTTLTYFALNVDGDGNIVKLANPQEEDPGWYTLSSGKANNFFANAKKNNVKLSLLISSGDTDAINQLMTNPIKHSNTLVKQVTPIMKKYGFSDLNLDIEYSSEASAAAQMHFTQFVQTVKEQLTQKNLGTLTLEISPTDVIRKQLILLQPVEQFADTIVLMAYDYHATDSFVTGPVAPINGAGIDSEYDVTSAVEYALQTIPSEKLVLGMPLYGYEWETLAPSTRSAPIPGSGVLASNNRMETFKTTFATCSATFDAEAQEMFMMYKDTATGSYHQISFPDDQSVNANITLANKKRLGGVALWALGYEGSSMLNPLADY